jgi:hypothetical protein
MDIYHEAPYYVFFYSALLPASSSVQIDFSASHFQTLAADRVPPAQKIKFQIHIRVKQETTLQCYSQSAQHYNKSIQYHSQMC